MGIKTITLRIAVDNDITEQDVGQVLRVALNEYVGTRMPASNARIECAEVLLRAMISVEESGCTSCGQTVGCNLACDACMQRAMKGAMT